MTALLDQLTPHQLKNLKRILFRLEIREVTCASLKSRKKNSAINASPLRALYTVIWESSIDHNNGHTFNGFKSMDYKPWYSYPTSSDLPPRLPSDCLLFHWHYSHHISFDLPVISLREYLRHAFGPFTFSVDDLEDPKIAKSKTCMHKHDRAYQACRSALELVGYD